MCERVVPRRNQMLEWTHAEKLIWAAKQGVEDMPAHPLLTDAVCLLSQAQERVADFVDGVPRDPSPTPPAADVAGRKPLPAPVDIGERARGMHAACAEIEAELRAERDALKAQVERLKAEGVARLSAEAAAALDAALASNARLRAAAEQSLPAFEALLVEVEPALTERRLAIEAQCMAQQTWADAQPPGNNRWAFMTEFREALERRNRPLLVAVNTANQAFDRLSAALTEEGSDS